MIINQPRLLCVTMYLCLRACLCVCGKTREMWRILLYSKTFFGDLMCLRKMGPLFSKNIGLSLLQRKHYYSLPLCVCMCLWLVLLTVCVFVYFSPTLRREHTYFCGEVFMHIRNSFIQALSGLYSFFVWEGDVLFTHVRKKTRKEKN